MAPPKRAHVTAVDDLNPWTRRVVCKMTDPQTLDFTGGQYIIVNSGRLLPNGKMGKRAYSIPTSDSSTQKFELVVRRIPDGTGSNFMHALKPGNSFEFSGPWGKYLPPESTENMKILVIATDTGLSAGLGLIRGSKFSCFLSSARLLWFVESDDYFMPSSFVKERMPKEMNWEIMDIPKVGEDSRVGICQRHIKKVLEKERFARIYVSGDGKIISGLEDLFFHSGYGKDQVIVETFFNHQELKTASIS